MNRLATGTSFLASVSCWIVGQVASTAKPIKCFEALNGLGSTRYLADDPAADRCQERRAGREPVHGCSGVRLEVCAIRNGTVPCPGRRGAWAPSGSKILRIGL